MELSKKIQLTAAFLLSAVVLLIWYWFVNPPPPIAIEPATNTIEKTYNLCNELNTKLLELEIEEQISKDLPLDRLEKLQAELEGILAKTYPERICTQYALIATTNGYYPCCNCNTDTQIYLNIGEIYKYGKTCIGEDRRYSDLEAMNLRFEIQFTGTEMQCLIMEKIKIYNYLFHPENVARALKNNEAPMFRPAGNCIDR